MYLEGEGAGVRTPSPLGKSQVAICFFGSTGTDPLEKQLDPGGVRTTHCDDDEKTFQATDRHIYFLIIHDIEKQNFNRAKHEYSRCRSDLNRANVIRCRTKLNKAKRRAKQFSNLKKESGCKK